MLLCRIKVLCLSSFILTSFISLSQDSKKDAADLVAMRMIGHHILLNAGDSISRVLPIKKNGTDFRIEFDTTFAFEPSQLTFIIDSIMMVEGVSTDYLVQVEQCRTKEISYSYSHDVELIQQSPCQSRGYPVDCYSLIITCYDHSDQKLLTQEVAEEEQKSSIMLYLILGCLGLLLTLFVYLSNRKKSAKSDSHSIRIGKYEFNKKKLTLSFENELIELTIKEADLLEMLYESANDILERETILKVVWEDQGVYVGRTLDVFISKLRKKLEADASVKILNIRGVGYKLVLDN